MTARTPTTIALTPEQGGTRSGLFYATVTTNDTVTLSNFTDIINRYVVNLADNSEATATIATNVVTVTQAGLTTQKVLIFAQGT